MQLEAIPHKAPGVIGRLIDGSDAGGTEAVLILPATGKVKVLNEVGARIWSLVDGKHSVGDIIQTVFEEYEVEYNTIQAHAVEFLYEIWDKGIITFTNPA